MFRSKCILIAWALVALPRIASGQDAARGAVDDGLGVAQVDAIRTSDHARFAVQLDALDRKRDSLSPSDQRHLRLLDGWEANYEGRYPQGEAIFREILARGDADVEGVRATSMLMTSLSRQGKYAEAYAIATRAADALPDVTDPLGRYVLLANLAQMLTFAGKPEQGLKYADMMLAATPAGESPCQALVQKVTALEGARKLTSASPELGQTLSACTADRQPVFANTITLILIDRLLAEHRAAEALTTLQGVAPSIKATGYFPHLIDMAAQQAQIYAAMDRPGDALKAARQTIAMGHPGDVMEALRSAYHVAYVIEKARGNHASALDAYEHYVVQDQGYLRDANVRNAAYEAASQHFVTEKLQTEGLSKENRILRLQQALDANTVETSRLYIVLMGLVLLWIVLWLVRIKRSQLRFKHLSSRDGLTGIFHHQHFMAEAERMLRALERRQGEGCLVYIDLDYFKLVNDTYGHAVGDAVLRHVVAICHGQLRHADLFGRLGGEEFGVLLGDTPRVQGAAVVERIRMALHGSPLVLEDIVVTFSASIGVACTDLRGYDLAGLCRTADAALYRAKRAGRNRCVIDRGEADPADPARLLDLDLTTRPGS